MVQEFLIALGSNLGSAAGNPKATLARAMVELSHTPWAIRRVSRFYATPCFPAGAGPDYVNACIALKGPDDADALLIALHKIEAYFGRERAQRWGSRSLDLDLLAAGAKVIPHAAEQTRWRDLSMTEQMRAAPDTLILPHPRLQDRAFVLVPLCDIAADWQHPLLHRTVGQMTQALPPALRAEVVAL